MAVARLLDEAALAAEAARLAGVLPHGAVVTLSGELGAGKTTFVRALVRALGAGQVASSPTFALVHRHAGRRGPILHLDAYRLRDPEEARDLDLAGLLDEADVLLIEWPERLGPWLPTPTHVVRLAHVVDPLLRAYHLETVP